MRLTINNLLKIFAAVLCIVFVGPSIIGLFERPSGEEGFREHRRKVKHSDGDGGGPNMGVPPPKGDLGINNNEAQVGLVSGCGLIVLNCHLGRDY